MRVLHLEDFRPDAELTAHKLAEAWPLCRVQCASTLEQFRAALKGGDFDLILSDYTLGGFDGLSALDLAREQCPEKPFIFLSGTIGEERAIEALKRGATDYVIKDRPTRLVPAIQQALARSREAQHHRETEESLRQHRERFQQIAENVADLIVMLDLSGHSIYCNPAYYTTVGRPAGQAGENVFGDIHPADRERARDAFRETVRTGQNVRVEYRLLVPAQAMRFVEAQNTVVRDASGAVTQVLVVARDVTERRAAQQRIAEQAALLDQAQDAIIVRDMEDRITYWNAGAARLYHRRADEAQGREAGALWTEDRAHVQVARDGTLFYGEWLGEMRQRIKSGAEIVVQSRWTLMQGTDGLPSGFLVINTDITEKKRLESQWLRAQRMDSIGLLAGGVAHDINNALTPIMVSSELLLPMVAGVEAQNLVTSIQRSAHHGTALVQQLLSFARGAAGQFAQLSLRPLVGDFVDFLTQTFPHTIKLTLNIAEEPWPVSGDATQLKQVLMNLCLNARDAMLNGGQITIDLANTTLTETEARALQDVQPGHHVTIAVTDTGPGMAPEIVDRIFDPFFTTKEVGKGTGLGLAAVRGIIKGHHGVVTVTSTPGQGSTFRLYLPARPDRSNRTSSSNRAGDPRGAGEGILLIDDEPKARDLFGSLLTAYGFKVFKAGSGEEGLKLFETHREKIALALTDVAMTGMNGIEVVRALRAQSNRLPILAMSEMAGTGVYENDLHALGVPFLAKPITRATLLAAVRTSLSARTT